MTSRRWPSSSSASSVKRLTSSEIASQEFSTIGLALLLHERLHARAVLSRSNSHGLISDARIHDGSGHTLQLQIYEHLRPPNCVAGPLEEAFAERLDRAVELGGGHTMVDESDLLRLLCSQQVAGQEVLLRTAEPDALRPDRSAAVACNQPKSHVRITDPGVLGGKDDITQQCHCRAESHGMPVQAAHDRLVEIEQRKDDALGEA